MSESEKSNQPPELPITRQIDSLCDEFESRLLAGDDVDLAAYLDRIEPVGRRPLLAELLPLYLEHQRELGKSESLEDLLRAYPEITQEIEQAFSELHEHQDTTDQRLPATIDHHRAGDTTRRKKSRGLKIRCPHCSNHVELISDTPLDSIDCEVCGSNFSLVDRSQETRLAQSLQQVDRFELVARIGVGGFGTVWKARDTELDRVVAIKIPRHVQLSEEELEQFLREARSAAQLRHPNVVPVHEVGRAEDTVFIVSDLIRGVSLADLLSGGRVSFREAAELCRTVADALEHAHQQGVIHRDLKPSNIMIDDQGTPFLMDFGLAKRDADEVTMTTDGQVIGTPAYMSPEQAEGRSAWADRRTDIYSIGIILFEMLTGELPFRGNAQMQVQGRLQQDAPVASSLNKHIPVDLTTICSKCLEREPGKRYQTAKEVYEECDRFLKNLPIKARPLSRLSRGFRWMKRNPLLTALGGLLGLLAIIGPVVALLIERQRAELAALVTQKDNLIQSREQERQAAVAQASTLQAELDVWEGKAHPKEFWPPTADYSPQKRQLAALLAARQNYLQSPNVSPLDETNLKRAKRLIALATLHEVAGRQQPAREAFLEAAQVLEVELSAQPTSTPLALALADLYQRLSNLAESKEEEQSVEWLEKSNQVLEKAYEMSPKSARTLAYQQDAALRASLAKGLDSAKADLEAALQTGARLKGLWPKSADEIYRLVCEFVGRPSYLAEIEATTTEGPE